MREVKAVPISVESFAPFGTFCNMVNPTGHALQGAIHSFYPECIYANDCTVVDLDEKDWFKIVC